MTNASTIRVVVVDDSVVIRRLLVDVLESDPGVNVVGTSSNGRLGVEAVRRLTPDVVVMDIEMPEMNGIEAVRAIRLEDRRVPIIMFSTLTERGARATFEALDAGATDYVPKPGQAGSMAAGMDRVREELLPKIHALASRGRPTRTVDHPTARATLHTAPPAPRHGPLLAPPRAPASLPTGFKPMRLPGGPAVRPHDAQVRPPAQVPRRIAGPGPGIVAIGSSTGGPEALSRVLGGLDADFAVPVVVVQHMPPEFTQLLSDRLDRTCAISVRHAEDGAELLPGTVLIARGGTHLEVVRDANGLRARLSSAPPENFCRPSVDVLFRSIARASVPRPLAVVLTGMGSDGTAGARDLAAAGATLWAQDEESSVVWGMPGSLVGAGLADRVIPLSEIAGALCAAVPAPPVRRLAGHAGRTLGGNRA